MDNKEEQMSDNDDGSLNLQGVYHPQGPHVVIQMQIQQQQQTYMVNQARGQSPCQHQRFDHGTIVGPAQGGPRMQAPPNMQNIPNMGQMGVSSPYGYVFPGSGPGNRVNVKAFNPVCTVSSVRKRVEPYRRAMHLGRFGGLSASIGAGNAINGHNEIAQQLQQLTLSPAQLQFGTPTGGQPDLQQASQGPVAGGSRQYGSTSSTRYTERRKLIHQQLVLLFHAHKCRLRERQANGEARICALPHCKTMKNVLTHMTTCEEGKKCTIPHCSSSRQIIAHWKQCQNSDCPVCSPPEQADKNEAADSRAAVAATQLNPNPDIRKPLDTMGIIQGQNNTSGSLSNQAVGHNVRMPGQGMQGHPGSTTVVESTNQQASMTGSTSAVAAAAATANQQQSIPGGFQPAQVTKEWHKSVTPELRNNLVHKVVQVIFPAPDPQAMFDKRLHNLVAYARKAEGDMYEMANSRSEYYHLMAEKIYKIQKELEEKSQKRKEMQLAQQQQQLQAHVAANPGLRAIVPPQGVPAAVPTQRAAPPTLRSLSPGMDQVRTIQGLAMQHNRMLFP